MDKFLESDNPPTLNHKEIRKSEQTKSCISQHKRAQNQMVSAVNSQFSSVAQLCLTLCDPPGLQQAKLPCPLLTPGVCSNSHSLSW